jgi:hypothetical protein
MAGADADDGDESNIAAPLKKGRGRINSFEPIENCAVQRMKVSDIKMIEQELNIT